MPNSQVSIALDNLKRDLATWLEKLELQCCYSAAVSRQARRFSLWAKWIVAAAASAPFIGQLRSVSETSVEWIIATVPLVAIGLPLWNPERTSEIALKLYGKLSVLLPRVRSVWRECRDFSGSESELAKLIERARTELQEAEKEYASFRSELALLPDIREMKLACEQSIPRYQEQEAETFRTEGKNSILFQDQPDH